MAIEYIVNSDNQKNYGKLRMEDTSVVRKLTTLQTEGIVIENNRDYLAISSFMAKNEDLFEDIKIVLEDIQTSIFGATTLLKVSDEPLDQYVVLIVRAKEYDDEFNVKLDSIMSMNSKLLIMADYKSV